MVIPYWSDIQAAAKTFSLDPQVVAGLVMTESGGDTCAWNPEPRYRYFWDVKHNKPFRAITSAELASKFPPPDFPVLFGDADQEWWAQQASWGLMQVMGAVAREHGYSTPYLTDMCVSSTRNLVVGCKHLRQLLDWSKGDVQQALAAYNGGMGGNVARPFHNQAYADKVLGKSQSLFA